MALAHSAEPAGTAKQSRGQVGNTVEQKKILGRHFQLAIFLPGDCAIIGWEAKEVAFAKGLGPGTGLIMAWLHRR
ncbi:hypothetical protein IF1G_07386 [Cordyceps javanica]|uniref:Uncharacterized protein n=1 Tax=Cordyceps javanica TaxID=43265 RepID=A0A545UW25_9HYPO|nr:hypothetical protein IF1G_07386 [Cordyceps javanica]